MNTQLIKHLCIWWLEIESVLFMESMIPMMSGYQIRHQALDPTFPKVMSTTDQILSMIEEFKWINQVIILIVP